MKDYIQKRIEICTEIGSAVLKVEQVYGKRLYFTVLCNDGLEVDELEYIHEDDLEESSAMRVIDNV